MQHSVLCALLLLLLAGCNKDNKDDSIIWDYSYRNLDTELIFEEEFNDLNNWKVDTSWEVNQWVGGSLPTGNACKIIGSSVFLQSTVEMDKYLSFPANVPIHKKCIIQKDLGSIPKAKRYLLEMDLMDLESYHSYSYENPSKHESRLDNGGIQILLTINGKMYDVFGARDQNDNCQTIFNKTTFKLLLDPNDQNNVALVNGDATILCSYQENSISNNSIIIKVNPHFYGTYGAAPGVSTDPQSCQIDGMRLWRVL